MFDKLELDVFCQKIDNQEDNEAKETLIEATKNGNCKYPTLVLKRSVKKQ